MFKGLQHHKLLLVAMGQWLGVIRKLINKELFIANNKIECGKNVHAISIIYLDSHTTSFISNQNESLLNIVARLKQCVSIEVYLPSHLIFLDVNLFSEADQGKMRMRLHIDSLEKMLLTLDKTVRNLYYSFSFHSLLLSSETNTLLHSSLYIVYKSSLRNIHAQKWSILNFS